MSWPVRSKQLASYFAAALANTTTAMATCPAGKTWLVKDVAFYNNTGTVRNVYLQIIKGGVGYNIHPFAPLGAAAIGHVSGMSVVVQEGESIGFTTSQAGSLQCVASGAQLG